MRSITNTTTITSFDEGKENPMGGRGSRRAGHNPQRLNHANCPTPPQVLRTTGFPHAREKDSDGASPYHGALNLIWWGEAPPEPFAPAWGKRGE